MKFINYLTSIAGIEIFPLISLLIFFGFFVVLAVWLLRTDKKRMNCLLYTSMSPLIAAVLMPLSSFSVILIATISTKIAASSILGKPEHDGDQVIQ